jgi:hypothetical protein
LDHEWNLPLLFYPISSELFFTQRKGDFLVFLLLMKVGREVPPKLINPGVPLGLSLSIAQMEIQDFISCSMNAPFSVLR